MQNLSPDVLHWIVLEVVHFVVEPSATAKADSQGGHVADHREAPRAGGGSGLAAPRSPLSKQPVLWRQRYDGHHGGGGGSVGALAAAADIVVRVTTIQNSKAAAMSYEEVVSLL